MWVASDTASVSSCDDGPSEARSFPCCALSTVEMVAVLSCSFMILKVEGAMEVARVVVVWAAVEKAA